MTSHLSPIRRVLLALLVFASLFGTVYVADVLTPGPSCGNECGD